MRAECTLDSDAGKDIGSIVAVADAAQPVSDSTSAVIKGRKGNRRFALLIGETIRLRACMTRFNKVDQRLLRMSLCNWYELRETIPATVPTPAPNAAPSVAN